MAITPRLDLRQSQSLVMTPQLQQAIKLLQLSNLELREYVEQELEENPLLERSEAEDNSGDGLGGPDSGAADANSGDSAEGEGLEAVDFSNPDKDGEAHANDMDVDIDNDWNTEEVSDAEIAAASMSEQAFSDWGSGGGSGTDMGGGGANLEEMMPEHISLRDHLTSQMAMTLFDPVERMIGAMLVDMLNDSGYVSGDLEQVSDSLGCDLDQVEDVLGKLQKFDPPGIFARDLGECLALQLQERDRYDPAMQTLLDNLDLLAKREIAALVKVCGVDEEDIIDMVEEIRELNPKPADLFDDVISQPVIPDVT
ncbi:MAG: RNA polymerase sigma-54 factor, partial [Rhodospirillaceae bacterium]|nr:RNA polymerase sigma-54 factor [Rhodospirillaceae bacterium]